MGFAAIGEKHSRIRGVMNARSGGSTSSSVGAVSFTAQSTSATLVSNTAYWIAANTLTLTLPAAPANNDWIILVNGGSYSGSTVARNGKNIMGLAEDMTLGPTYFAIKLVYRLATTDWRLAT